VAGELDPDQWQLLGVTVETLDATPEATTARATWSNFSLIAHVEMAHLRGVSVVLFLGRPWGWLRRYPQLAYHLRRTYPFVVERDDCVAVALQQDLTPREVSSLAVLEEIILRFYWCFGRSPAILDWRTDLQLTARLPQYAVFSPIAPQEALPYLDRSVDIVITPTGDAAQVGEATRVASAATVAVSPPEHPGSSSVEDAAERSGAGESVVMIGEMALSTPPAVSVVIPLFGDGHGFETAVRGLHRTVPYGLACEIVLAGGNQPAWREVVQPAQATGFNFVQVKAGPDHGVRCTEGARAATGDFLVILAEDALLLPQWLFFALRTFRDHPDAAVVGGKIVDTGGYVESLVDGEAVLAGNPDLRTDGDDPAHSFVRRVDACATTLLITRRDAFEDVGGFTGSTPAEAGVDYCRRVRARGGSVYFQPKAAAIHPMAGVRTGVRTPVGADAS
jgi:hypothetical protein